MLHWSRIFWQIPALCHPALYLDPQSCKRLYEASQSHITGRRHPSETQNSTDNFWRDSKLQTWASTEGSSLLVVQGDFQTTQAVESIALDVVDYLETKSQQVVLIFDALIDSEGNIEKLTTAELLKQVAVQIMRINKQTNTLGMLGKAVAAFNGSTTSTEWFVVVESVLFGLQNIYMVIDLAILDTSSMTETPWETEFQNLFGRLQVAGNKPYLKVTLFTCRPFSTDTSTLIIDVKTESSLQHMKHLALAQTSLLNFSGVGSKSFPLLARRVPPHVHINGEDAPRTADSPSELSPVIGGVAAKGSSL
jgi:hypothetical protein